MKKIRKTILIVVLAIIVIIGIILLLNSKSENTNSTNNINADVEENNEENIVNQEIINNQTENTNIQNEIINTESESTGSKNNSDEPGTSKETGANENLIFDETVAFIGDSRTQGFLMYTGLKDVVDYTYIGLMVDTAVTKKFVKTSTGEEVTLLEDMKNRNIQKVYIMLGINELGWSYSQVFVNDYAELIRKIKEIKPNCEIYLQSIIPVTKEKSDSDDIYNNTKIAEYNRLIKDLAARENVKYLDVKSAVVDSGGNLPSSASTDGIHINKTYCLKWLDYIKNNS